MDKDKYVDALIDQVSRSSELTGTIAKLLDKENASPLAGCIACLNVAGGSGVPLELMYILLKNSHKIFQRYVQGLANSNISNVVKEVIKDLQENSKNA